MLGEIFGRNAGLTCTELVLFRFFAIRLLASVFLPGCEPMGDASPGLIGLWLALMGTLAWGRLSGVTRGVFFPALVGVI